MKFEFDTTNDGAKEAAALATALVILHGQAVVDALDKAEGSFEHRTTLASDGHPVTRADISDESVPVVEKANRLGADTGLLDTAGIPWDERIHASTKTTNKDGTWTRRRNTPDETFDAVMAELKARSGQPEVEASASEAFGDPTPSVAPAPPVTDGSGEATTDGQTATTAASPSNPVPPPPPATSVAPITFPALTVKMVKAKAAGTLSADKADEILAAFDLTTMAQLNSAGADTIQAVNAMVDEHLANG